MEKNNRKIPSEGSARQKIMNEIKERKNRDADWKTGKVFGFVYYPGDEAAKLVEEICRIYLYDNALNPGLFPSIRQFENELVAMTADLLNAGSNYAGNITTGGSESIFLALKSAVGYTAKFRPDILNPEIIMPSTAHPAFKKAADALKIKVITIPVTYNKQADTEAMEKAVSKNTILLIGSAPCFPYGTIDPIEKIGSIARKYHLLFHVDACLGGFMIPFLKKCGYPTEPFDFSVPGVTSVSVDLHKFGYCPKGVSVILYRSVKIRRFQFFADSEWSGGNFCTTGFTGSRSGFPVVAAWALLHYFGQEGYMKLAEKTMETAALLKKEINRINGLKIIGQPAFGVFAINSDKYNIFEIGDKLDRKGWHLSRLQFPDALHINITHYNSDQVIPFLNDLREITTEMGNSFFRGKGKKLTASVVYKLADILPEKLVRKITGRGGKFVITGKNEKKSRNAFMYGMASSLKSRKNMKEILLDMMDRIYW